MAVRDHDERWDELALAHVLGGLRADDASEFRAHLAGCSQCRARVAELRSLDSEMAAAEREERAAARLRTRVEHSSDDDRALEPPEDLGRQRRQGLVLMGVVVAVLFGLSLWNAHLRAENATLTRLAEAQEQTLGALGGGTVVPVQTSSDVTGVVSVDEDRVAMALAGLPRPEAGDVLVVWLRHPDGVDWKREFGPSAMEARRLETTVTPIGDATELLVTIEPANHGPAPSGRTILTADLGTR